MPGPEDVVSDVKGAQGIINERDQPAAIESCTIDKNSKNFFVRPRMGF